MAAIEATSIPQTSYRNIKGIIDSQNVKHILHLNGLLGSHSNLVRKSAAKWPKHAAPIMLIISSIVNSCFYIVDSLIYGLRY